MTPSSTNRRIARNTLILYVRMFVLMVISFFTTRVTLSALGVENFGIYNVVGGLVAMFSLVSGSLSASISRYITYGLGRGDAVWLKKVFGASVNIQLLMAIGVVMLLETVGLWFLTHRLVIPPERMWAAHIVFQASVLGFVVSLLSLPYNAAIIAHEKMSAFAYMTLFEGFAKFGIAYAVLYVAGDRLVLYALLILAQAVISQIIYWIYCRSKFAECVYTLVRDRRLYKEIIGFSGWNFIGTAAGVLSDQGVNVVLNLFFGPVLNTARGIGLQVSQILGKFSGNFMTAVNPQITKSYASEELDRTWSLVSRGAKFSFFLFFFLSMPVLLETPQAIRIWLGQIPQYSVGFARLAILFTWSSLLSAPLITALLATGRIRNYQIVVGLTNLLNLPLSYLCLHLGAPPVSVMWVAVSVSVVTLFQRLWFLQHLVGFRMWRFVRDVCLRIVLVAVCAAPLPLAVYLSMPSGLLRAAVVALVCFAVSLPLIYYVGLDRSEREFLISLLRRISGRIFPKSQKSLQ